MKLRKTYENAWNKWKNGLGVNEEILGKNVKMNVFFYPRKNKQSMKKSMTNMWRIY